MTICHVPVYNYESENFLLRATSSTERTEILMNLKGKNISTCYYPHTKDILEKELPDVFTTECFNDDELPFEAEVENTEIAHLLEHILLQLLYSKKTKILNSDTEYNGYTKWNWKKEKFGTFHIEVDSGYADRAILKDSIKRAISLTEAILNYHLSLLVGASVLLNFCCTK